mmetsp:Transcript_27788/g.69397  ORF Transcript_27788/g.69397 Transcript_27788/m.69397 type:complete len:82 (-) Transcript_27788:727-972(-)
MGARMSHCVVLTWMEHTRVGDMDNKSGWLYTLHNSLSSTWHSKTRHPSLPCACAFMCVPCPTQLMAEHSTYVGWSIPACVN